LPLIGWAKPVPVNTLNLRAPRRDFAIIAVAGPLSNLLLATVASGIFLGMLAAGGGVFGGSPRLEMLLIRAVEMNMLLAVFNLIPVPPLDGGNVLAGLVPESIARLIDRLRPYGFFILYALMLSGLLSVIFTPVIDFVWGMLLR
jgi:Zn-dependent protease